MPNENYGKALEMMADLKKYCSTNRIPFFAATGYNLANHTVYDTQFVTPLEAETSLNDDRITPLLAGMKTGFHVAPDETIPMPDSLYETVMGITADD